MEGLILWCQLWAYRQEHLDSVRDFFPPIVIMKSYEEIGVILKPADIYQPFISVQTSYRICLKENEYVKKIN